MSPVIPGDNPIDVEVRAEERDAAYAARVVEIEAEKQATATARAARPSLLERLRRALRRR